MQFTPHRQSRPMRENIVPMINVVFLLLIFFLMTAQIAPPEPFAVTPPVSTGSDPAEGDRILYVAADGTLAYGSARGDAALAALTEAGTGNDDPLLLRADANLKATEMARLLARLAAAGVAHITLVTTAQP